MQIVGKINFYVFELRIFCEPIGAQVAEKQWPCALHFMSVGDSPTIIVTCISAAPSISAGVINSTIIHPFLWLNSRMKDDTPDSATADIPRENIPHSCIALPRAHRFQCCLSKRKKRECENEKLIFRYVLSPLSYSSVFTLFFNLYLVRMLRESPLETRERRG